MKLMALRKQQLREATNWEKFKELANNSRPLNYYGQPKYDLTVPIACNEQKPKSPDSVQFYTPQYHETNDECSICVSEFTDYEIVTKLACNDKHIFHKSCITKWIS